MWASTTCRTVAPTWSRILESGGCFLSQNNPLFLSLEAAVATVHGPCLYTLCNRADLRAQSSWLS